MFWAGLSTLHECLQVSLEPTRVKQLSGATLSCRLLALPTNIKQGWKGLPGKNSIAYFELSQIVAVKSFITLGPGANPERNSITLM